MTSDEKTPPQTIKRANSAQIDAAMMAYDAKASFYRSRGGVRANERKIMTAAVEAAMNAPKTSSVYIEEAAERMAVIIAANDKTNAEDEIARVVQSVNEWDDRTSPDDYPDHLLITSEELTDILRNFAETLRGRRDG